MKSLLTLTATAIAFGLTAVKLAAPADIAKSPVAMQAWQVEHHSGHGTKGVSHR